MWVSGTLMVLETLWATKEASCPAYQCANTTHVPFNSTTCVYYEQLSTTYYTAACTDHYSKYCPPINYQNPSHVTNSTCQLPLTPPLIRSWPGEACLNDTFCAIGNCESGLCYGQSLNETCDGNQDCSPGLFCSMTDNMTQFEYAPGQLGCENDYECQNTAGCHLGECVPYMSVLAGSAIHSCGEDGMNFLCEHLSCVTNTTASYCTGLLTSSTPSTDSSPTPCIPQNSTYCLSALDPITTTTYPGRCLCSYSPLSTGYCAAFPGDPVGLSYQSYLKQWLNSTAILLCNTERRFSTQCMQTHWDPALTNNYTYAALKYQYYPSMLGMDNCTKSVYLLDYFQAEKLALNPPSNEGGRVAWGVGLLLGVFFSA